VRQLKKRRENGDSTVIFLICAICSVVSIVACAWGSNKLCFRKESGEPSCLKRDKTNTEEEEEPPKTTAPEPEHTQSAASSQSTFSAPEREELGPIMSQLEALRNSGEEPNLEELGPIMSKLEAMGLVRSDSMEMTNDPRFFQENILNKRLAAFSGLSVVATLMVGFTKGSISQGVDLGRAFTFEGQLQGVGFLLDCGGLFINIIATYVSVAQIYHVYRLESAGPTGFEMATSYYLNPNIVAWRHLAIKCLLLGLPVFLISIGLQVEVEMGNAAATPSHPSLIVARCFGLAAMCLFSMMGAVVWYIHSLHDRVFRDRYQVAMADQSPFLSHVQALMAARRQLPRGTESFDV